jgi:uncharacterized protein (UPF0261 family)
METACDSIGNLMAKTAAIAIVGTFDSKGEEHLFLKECIERRGFPTLTVNVGTKGPSPFRPDADLYEEIRRGPSAPKSRDEAIQITLQKARTLIQELHHKGELCGVIAAGGGTGTHLCTSIMRVLPLGVPKVMVSTVASRDMKDTVGTKDITMMHSVADILGVNSILGHILDKAAGAVCGMAESRWEPKEIKKRIALTMFGFITRAAEAIKGNLESMGYEVIAFHANGTGGMAMEELAREGLFDGILDLATHELADDLKGGYCAGIGPERLEPIPERQVPRLVVPGGLDCAVLEFTRDTVPEAYQGRPVFFYDFRSAIRLNEDETIFLAGQMAQKLNRDPSLVQVLIPQQGWSEADREGAPLYDPAMNERFVHQLKAALNVRIAVMEADFHINDPGFAQVASETMKGMLE